MVYLIRTLSIATHFIIKQSTRPPQIKMRISGIAKGLHRYLLESFTAFIAHLLAQASSLLGMTHPRNSIFHKNQITTKAK